MTAVRDKKRTQKIKLRPIEKADQPFLAGLYASTRDDINSLPLPDEQKRVLCEGQFDLQHQHYTKFFADASFDMVLVNGVAAGRLYVDRTDEEIRVVDISLLPEFRNQGLGSRLMSQVIKEAARQGKPLRLRVHPQSSMRRWYERLGFEKIADEELTWHMEKRVPN